MVAIRHAGIIHTAPRPKRHHDVIHKMSAAGLPASAMHDQGFVTSAGRFVDRKEAVKIAIAAGQLKREGSIVIKTSPAGLLFSEDLW